MKSSEFGKWSLASVEHLGGGKMKGRIRIALLFGIAGFTLLWGSPTTAQKPTTFSQTCGTPDCTAIEGDATATSGFTIGVRGQADSSPEGAGVRGVASQGVGVQGEATNGVGVQGLATATTGNTYGVIGVSDSPTGTGVRGRAAATSGLNFGVVGVTDSTSGRGVVGLATATSGGTFGLLGQTDSFGDGTPTGLGTFGVFGNATATSGNTVGVAGDCASLSCNGVSGHATATTGLATGVRGQSDSTSGQGVVGLATATSGNTVAVVGHCVSPNCKGVDGHALATSGVAVGVSGISDSTSGVGVIGIATATSGSTFGVAGEARSPNGIAITGNGVNGALAGNFVGPVQISCPSSCLTVNGTVVAVPDLAEDMPVVRPVSPGDVVALTQGRGYGIAPAAQAYDTQVAGIVSTAPRVRFGIGKVEAAPVAMVGVVKAKASAINGAIKFGDLLTTSPVAGHLMRCEAAVRCVGAIVGKALEPLAKGQGQILVLVWRQ